MNLFRHDQNNAAGLPLILADYRAVLVNGSEAVSSCAILDARSPRSTSWGSPLVTSASIRANGYTLTTGICAVSQFGDGRSRLSGFSPESAVTDVAQSHDVGYGGLF
jgi:hypothetical protein